MSGLNTNDKHAPVRGDANQVLTALGATGLDVNDKHPITRGDLNKIAEAIEEGGGSGGTTNYNSLTNKPQVNDVELSGNKTSEQLKLLGQYATAPTASASLVNYLYQNTTDGKTYICKESATTAGTYEWREFGKPEKKVVAYTAGMSLALNNFVDNQISGNVTGNLTITFNIESDYSDEFMLYFETGSSFGEITFTNPTGYTITGLPTFEASNRYELNFKVNGNELDCKGGKL